MQTDGMIALSAMVCGVALAGMLTALRSQGSIEARRALFLIFALFAGVVAIPLVVAFARPLYVFYMPAVLPMLLALPVPIHCYARLRAASDEVPALRARDGWLPAAGLIVMLGYWSLPAPSRDMMFVDGVLPPGLLPSALALATVGLILLWSATSFGYLFATTRALRAYRDQLKATYSNTELYELRWIDGLLTLLATLWAAAALSLVADNVGPGLLFREELIFLLAAAVLLLLLVFAVLPSPQPEDTPALAAEAAEEQPTDKYTRSALTADRAQLIAERVTLAMRQDELYLDANLSLQRLSQHVRTPPNIVSQTLNETLEMTFFDFVAHWRINAAKPLIEAGEASVLSIALDVGFNSRSTFYKAFKRETGMTPKAFRESRRDNCS